MKKNTVIFSFIFILFVSSCEYFNLNDDSGLSTDEIIEGLKTALEIGTDSSTAVLSAPDGYYMDALVKIPLPDDALKVQTDINAILSLAPSLSSYLNLDVQFENVVKSINRAAENAASEAAPIFGEAVSDLSISDGWDILNGIVPTDSVAKSAEFDSTAATEYFKIKTYTALTDLFAPKIDVVLDQDLGLGFSANEAWTALRTTYNSAVNTITGNYFTNLVLEATGYSLEPLETESIGVFATEKALDGLFFKVGEEEKKIRKDPFQWAVDIIQKVFGYIQDQL
jgi:hypothetical protein